MWCFYSPCVLFACLRPHVWLSCVLDLVSLIKWHRMWMNPGSVHRLWNIPASKRICMKRVLGLGPIINRIQFFNNQLYLLLPFQLRTCPDIWTSFTYEFQKLFRESGHDIARSCLFLNAAHNRQWPESGAFTLLELLSLVWAAVLPGWDVQEAASTTPACTLWIQKTHMFSCGLNQILHLYSGAGKVMSVLCPDLLHQTFAFSHERRETSGKGQGCRACVKTAWQSGKRTLKQISSVRTMRQKIRKISANIHSS